MPLYWNEYTPHYVAVIAIHAALDAEQAKPAPAPPKPPLPNCPKCKGTGKVRTGDGLNWTECSCTERAACPDGKCPVPLSGSPRAVTVTPGYTNSPPVYGAPR